MNRTTPSTYFLTGITGFLGAYLAKEILTKEPDSKIIALVRSPGTTSPSGRVRDALLPLLGADSTKSMLQRVEPVEGDVTLARLGLDKALVRRLAAQVSCVVHCAASIEFDMSLDEARARNVAATANIVQFVQHCALHDQFEKFAYTSTAYVAGVRGGVISESDPIPTVGFNNTYEQSKAEAETMVHGIHADVPVTVLRPSIIVGDSRTGYVKNINTVYYALQLGHRGLLPVSPNGYLDFINVDYAASAMHHIVRHPDSTGRIFHLTAGKPYLTEWKTFAATTFAHLRALDPRARTSAHRVTDLEEYNQIFSERRERYSSRVVEAMQRFHQNYVPYLIGDTKYFNDDRTQSLLFGSGLRKHVLNDLAGLFAEYCIRSNWTRKALHDHDTDFSGAAAALG